MLVKKERQSAVETSKKVERKVDLEVAEKLGKFSKMVAKNGAGDKSGIYGH